jgi:hypothetical protein
LKPGELKELQYITLITNMPSILANGILSFNRATNINHQSCASPDVQERRMKVIVPGGRPLHDYANLYFNARNPMMYVLKNQHSSLAVVAVDPSITNQQGVVISDCNAARDMALFKPAPGGLALIDPDVVYAKDWTHQNAIEYYEHRGRMCAEVLVPDKVDKRYILKVYVSNANSGNHLMNICGAAANALAQVIDSDLFFQ